MSSEQNVVTSSSELLTGRVKWFNNKAGYGFITVTDGRQSGSDIFIHHSAINVDSQQYKYLVQGEYVGFSLIKTSSGAHEWQASNVSGINGGKLMCETRHEFKLARSVYKTDSPQPLTRVASVARTLETRTQETRTQETKLPKQQRVPKAPKLVAAGGEDWTTISKKPRVTRGPSKKTQVPVPVSESN
jgi:CspA family cold shock protein